MTSKKEIHESGYLRGWNVASWQDVPAIGTEIPRHIDWVGYRIVDTENQRDVWEMYCFEAESHGREFSPFEHTAHDLNEIAESKSYDVWEIYDAGIAAGIRAYWRKNLSRRAA